MSNPLEKRYNTYSDYFKRTFGERVQKVTIDAGFTCPNRDGTLGYGGCTYCNNMAFNPSYCNPLKSISQQIKEGIEFHLKRYRKARKYLAYFQPFTNTHGKLEYLKNLYEEALNYQGIIGLAIGTRPDCISDEKLDYFQKLTEKYYIIIEYGIESCYNKTLERVKRGHSFEKSVEAIEKTAQRGIKTGAHLIFGLPGETRDEMLNEANIISDLPLNNVKFHQLQILKDTLIALEYKKCPENFRLFKLDEYFDFLVEFLERLNPEFVVERFAGEVPPGFLAGPTWGLIRNDQIINLLKKKLEKKNTWQGKKYKKIL